MRVVTVGRTVNRETIVTKGIAAGEMVVTDGQLRLAPGFKVEIVKAVQGDAGSKAGGASQ
jgi:multidrug efflux system membrane fusion protein